MFTLIKMKTRKSLKHKNSKAHILFVIRAMKSSCHGASEKFHNTLKGNHNMSPQNMPLDIKITLSRKQIRTIKHKKAPPFLPKGGI